MMRAYFALVVVFLISGEGHSVQVPAIKRNTCPSDQERLNIRSEILQNVSALLSCGGVGWRRVGYLDMTDPSQSCPSGLALRTHSSGLRACGRAIGNSGGCQSTFYNTGSSPYSRVCGRIRGYQVGASSAFLLYATANVGFNSYYVDGVSLTHISRSGSRTHIWTFAGTLSEVFAGQFGPNLCTCVTSSGSPSPPFVGNDYFCESGLHVSWNEGGGHFFYPDDPLWDGQNCVSSCCQFNNPPYFTKTLPAPTTDNIELRICSHFIPQNTGTPIDQVELYVQ